VIGINNATGISAGGWNTCASLANRQVKCWGLNQNGQLGDKSTSHHFRTLVEGPTGVVVSENADASPTPVTVTRMNNAKAVAFGLYHACALLDSGAVRCWGAGGSGQLGIGRSIYGWKSWPRWVKGIDNAVAIGAGGRSSCAVLSSGGVKCWGDAGGSSPITVKEISSATAVSVSNEGGYVCALVAGGKVECWYAESVKGGAIPSVIAGISGAQAIDASSRCAIIAGGSVACWPIHVGFLPTALVGVMGAVQLGDDNCAVLSTGRVACWQKGSRASLIKGIANARAITGGYYHRCALLKNREVKCWGDNTAGQLGDGRMQNYSAVPVRVFGLS
jgi:alpha-tubulin suppressor-like RCC1 family protein